MDDTRRFKESLSPSDSMLVRFELAYHPETVEILMRGKFLSPPEPSRQLIRTCHLGIDRPIGGRGAKFHGRRGRITVFIKPPSSEAQTPSSFSFISTCPLLQMEWHRSTIMYHIMQATLTLEKCTSLPIFKV